MPSPLIVPRFQWETTAGAPAVGYKLNSYVAGTSTPQPTYPTQVDAKNLTNANPNPTILDSLGSANIWLPDNLVYKFILTDALNNTIWTVDNVSQGGVAVASAGASVSEWIQFAGTPTFVNTLQFTLSGDQTSIFTVGRRIRCTVTAGTVYATVTASSFGGGITTITVVMDSGVLDSGLSSVSYGIIGATNTSLPLTSQVLILCTSGQNLASATTYLLGKGSDKFPVNTSFDLLGEFNTGTGNFTPKYGGLYLITATINIIKNAATITHDGFASVTGSATQFGVGSPFFPPYNTDGNSSLTLSGTAILVANNAIQISITSPTFTGGPVQTGTSFASFSRIK